MTAPQSDFLRLAIERGFLHQVTDAAALDARLGAGPLPAYIGFDCTADSLHVGSLMQIMLLRRLQQTGHKPVVLMGGGTTKVGDPSFRDEARPLLDDAAIERNKAGIRKVFDAFLTFGGGATDAIMLDNAEWLDELRYIPFLREVGRHFSVNRMLTMDSVKLRLDREQNLTFLEFNYMLLQSYDFSELQRRYGVAMQMGGSDQWGNIVMGVELCRRMNGAEVFGMTTPLLTTASGAKMGKTAAGAVWLNAEKLSSYDYYQFWRNTEDADVGRFLGLFTELEMPKVRRLGGLVGAEINHAKDTLAYEATALLHGRAAADKAAETSRRVFENREAADGLPTVQLDLSSEVQLPRLVVQIGFAKTNQEARRAIANNAISVNDTMINNLQRTISMHDVRGGKIKISFGKKKHILIQNSNEI
jgi:tyrosyl-tRNA synthetase